jgi:Ca2+:H+ antiporter
MKSFLKINIIAPILAWLFYLSGFVEYNFFCEIIGGVLLIASVLGAVHHSEVVAHKVGEPFGTIILAVAVTIIEVGIIISLMIAGGEDAAMLARDTVFAATMIILNGIVGASLLIGGLKYKEQFFSSDSTNIALVSLVAIIVLTLILPNFTTSINGPIYTEVQLIFVATVCFVIYATFLIIQTVRHRDYFIANSDKEVHFVIAKKDAAVSLLFLIISLVIVVLLAKTLSHPIEDGLIHANLPKSLVGVIIALIILLPEGIAAIKAANNNKLQSSLNLSLGSALASIGLTIPAVALVCSIYHLNLVLGLDKKAIVLLGLSVFIVMLSLSKGKTNILYGVVLLMNLLAYIFTIINP